ILLGLALSSTAPNDDAPTVTPRSEEPSSVAHARVLVGIERAAGGVLWGDAERQIKFYGEPMVPGAYPDAPVAWALTAPRLAVDVVFQNVTVGLGASVLTPERDLPEVLHTYALHYDAAIALVAPRVGALFCDHGRICFWPKAGLAIGTISGALSGSFANS